MKSVDIKNFSASNKNKFFVGRNSQTDEQQALSCQAAFHSVTKVK
jgi:hypothetical protein